MDGCCCFVFFTILYFLPIFVLHPVRIRDVEWFALFLSCELAQRRKCRRRHFPAAVFRLFHRQSWWWSRTAKCANALGKGRREEHPASYLRTSVFVWHWAGNVTTSFAGTELHINCMRNCRSRSWCKDMNLLRLQDSWTRHSFTNLPNLAHNSDPIFLKAPCNTNKK